MKDKNSYVKRLRTFLESEVTEAEVVMGARKFSTQLQEMIEKIGRIQNEGLPPLVDQMRETFGEDTTVVFQDSTHSVLQGVMDALYEAKDSIDHNVRQMAIAGGLDMDAFDRDSSDFDRDLDADLGGEMVPDLGPDDMGELGDISSELDTIGDEGDIAPAPSNSILGRTKKESIEQLTTKLTKLRETISKLKKHTVA